MARPFSDRKMDSAFLPSNYTVLVVDSNPRDRADLTALLERTGYRTQTYASGEDLLQGLPRDDGNFCVIAEVELPGMNGIELISQLRRDNVLVPAVILTRLDDVPTAVRALRSDVADYLTKPYVERDLITRLRQALTGEVRQLH